MQDIQDMRQCLHEQLQHFEIIQEQIGEGIIEVQKRSGILDVVMSWSPIEVEPYQARAEALCSNLSNSEGSQGIKNRAGLEDAYHAVDREDTEIPWAYQELPPGNGF